MLTSNASRVPRKLDVCKVEAMRAFACMAARVHRLAAGVGPPLQGT